ncbi:hypothetical protein ABEB36_006790 [Hypothenemus hampei]|uniref:Uncharacterized protein n=1 Tax=Hypothenemus hampei TaxID=57062 RepID=A0ABD1ERT1_HYPHA
MVIFEETTTELFPNVTTTVTPSFHGDDAKYLIVPLVVIVLVMLLSLLVYCMAKQRRMNRLRQDVARLYHFDENDLEWQSLNSYDHPNYQSGDFNIALRKSDEDLMPITNL